MHNRLLIWYNLIPLLVFIIFFPARLYIKAQTTFSDGQQVLVKSCLTEQPVIQSGKQKFKIEGIFVNTAGFVRYNYGDCLQITGTLQEQVITFFYSKFYLIDQEITKNLLPANNQKLSLPFHAFYQEILSKIFTLRARIQNIYYQSFSVPMSQLLAGIVLGTKEDYRFSFFKSLQNSGTLHIVAASGMNLVLFVGPVLHFLAKMCSRRKALVLVFILIWFYVILSGLQASIIRAALMLSFVYLGQLLGRGTSTIRLLFLVGGGMLLWQPLYLFDIGFWLSFAATSGLVYLSPAIQQRLERFRPAKSLPILNFFNIKESFVETSGAYLMTFPIITLVFYQTNPLSLIPNILILWLIPYIMIIGGLIAVVGLINLSIAILFAQILYPALAYMVWIIQLFGKTLNTSWQTPDLGQFAIVFMLLYYFGISKIINKLNKNNQQK